MDFPRPSMSASELFGDLKDKLGFGGGRSDRRDDYYDDESENKNIAEIIIAKNRHGEIGTVDLHWDGQFTRFTALDVNR